MGKINKILLVNDVRMSHEYLRRAFEKMGIECDVVLFTGYKKELGINYMNFDQYRNWGYFGKLVRPFLNLYKVKKLGTYDVASYVHRISFIAKPYLLRYLDLGYIREKVGIMSYTGLGCDELAYIEANEMLPYSPCITCKIYDDLKGLCERKVQTLNLRAYYNLNRYFDYAFSTAVEYSHISKSFNNNVYKMPLPVDVSEVPWMPAGSKKNRKIKIIHTPSRIGFKGTDVVLSAINILKKKREDFEFNVVSGLSFNSYIDAISDADIIIDQVWSQSPGMNALWLLAMGKIVFSGNTELAKNYFPFSFSNPIYDASPNPDILAKNLNEVILMRNGYASHAELGREYIKKYHDNMSIAKQYLKIWESRI